MRYVLDTNVIVSALLAENGKPAWVFQYALRHGKILLSHDALSELEEVLGREKFRKYISLKRCQEFIVAFAKLAERVEVIENITECADPKDNKFLELAVSGKADFIITGDADLLAMHPFRGIAIVTIESFLTTVGLN